MINKSKFVASSLALCVVITATTVAAKSYGEWGIPENAEVGSHPSLNTPFLEGCPNISPDGLTLYFASNRDGYTGQEQGLPRNIDIYIARRSTTVSGWGEPENLGGTVNSTRNDVCPTPVRGKGLFFVSEKTGNGDIYFTRRGNDGLWQEPALLGPHINSAAVEASPSYFEDELGQKVLYFSSTRTGHHDIYQSVNFGPAHPAPGALNTPFQDARPNVSRDGREIVFDSNRPGSLAFDIWTARRSSTSDPWPAARRLTNVSSPAGDFRPALSWDGTSMFLGWSRSGSEVGSNGINSSDIWVTTRQRVDGTYETQDDQGDED